MKFAKLGGSNLRVSNVCLGTMTWGSQNTEGAQAACSAGPRSRRVARGRPPHVVLPARSRPLPCAEEAHAQLDAFVAAGGNFIDTAEARAAFTEVAICSDTPTPAQLYPVPPDAKYGGATETMIGNWLEKHPAQRASLVIATKVAGPTPSNWIPAAREKVLTGTWDDAAPLPRLVPEQIKRAVAASLVRLKTGYIDLLQLHWPDRYTPLWGSNVYLKGMEGKHQQQPRDTPERVPFDDVVRCLAELMEAGTIKAWGVSNETSFGVCQWVESAKRLGVSPPISIQNDFSLLDRRFEGELAETCSDINCNLGLLAYGCLNGGVLSGKYADGAKPAKARHALFPGFQARYHCDKALEAAARYAAIAAEAGLTPTQLALAWAYSRHFMAAVIIGATTLEQLDENIKAACIELPKSVLAAVDAVHADIRNPNLRN